MTRSRDNATNVAGDISGVTAGTGLSGGGTNGSVTLDLSTPVASTNGGTGLSSFTTGDIIYSSSGNTLAKLGIGTTSQVLTVASGIPSWTTPSSGGMTLISTTTLSGSSVTLSSIPSTYKHLQLIISGVTANTSNNTLRILPNNVNNLSDGGGARGYSSAADSLGYVNNVLYPHNIQSTLRTDANNVTQITIFNYASASYFKSFLSTYRMVGTDSNTYSGVTGGSFSLTTAISSLVIDYGGTNTFSAGQVLFYGVN